MDMDNKQSIKSKKEIEFYFWIHSVFRRYVEVIMDIILMGLVLVSFILITKTIYLLSVSLYNETNIAYVITEIMFIFILVETVRLLIIYLEFHRVALDSMVEIAIVSVIREIILKGFLHIEPIMITVASLFLIVLGLLLRFGGIKPEDEIYSQYKPFLPKCIKGQKTNSPVRTS
jgi:uncharacterized membrane protein (DUF373 family)